MLGRRLFVPTVRAEGIGHKLILHYRTMLVRQIAQDSPQEHAHAVMAYRTAALITIARPTLAAKNLSLGCNVTKNGESYFFSGVTMCK